MKVVPFGVSEVKWFLIRILFSLAFLIFSEIDAEFYFSFKFFASYHIWINL